MLISRTSCAGWRWKEQDGSTQKLCRCKQEKPLRNNLSLKERQLISTGSTTVTTRDGLKLNSNLLYTIRLIQLALDQFYE